MVFHKSNSCEDFWPSIKLALVLLNLYREHGWKFCIRIILRWAYNFYCKAQGFVYHLRSFSLRAWGNNFKNEPLQMKNVLIVACHFSFWFCAMVLNDLNRYCFSLRLYWISCTTGRISSTVSYLQCYPYI